MASIRVVTLDLWDGQRPLTVRNLVHEDEVVSRGIRLRYVSERIETPTDWCCHDDARHLLYVHRGGALNEMRTTDDWGSGGADLPQVGDVWLVPAGAECASLAQGRETAQYCEIAIPTALIGREAPAPRMKVRDSLIYQLTDRIAHTMGRTDVMAGLLADSLVEALRLHVADVWAGRRARRRPSGRETLDPATQRVIAEFIEDALDTEITLDALAAMAEMTVGRFMKAFAAAFHTTPHQFVLDRRIDRAKALLLNSSCSIAEVSAAVGFSTPNHFATVFRKRVGASPSAFRRGLRG